MSKSGTPKTEAPYQSRDASAYDGAKLKPWGKTRGDSMSGSPTPKPATPDYVFPGAGPLAGNTYTASPYEAQVGAAQGIVDKPAADAVWAETQGGPIAGVGYPSEKYAVNYSANVPVWSTDDSSKETKQKAPLFMQSAKPDEVEKLVSMGVISRTTADKIYAKRNEEDPMQKMRAKTPPAPGMDYAPSASGLPPEAFAAPLPAGKPLTSPALPAAPAPAPVAPTTYAQAAPPQDDYTGALAWARKKWGL